VWIKVACKNPAHINSSSEVYINKQGYKITWCVSEQGPPKTNQDPHDKSDNKDEETDEEEQDSQDNYDELTKEILKGGAPPEQKSPSESRPKSTPGAGSHRQRTLAAEDQGMQCSYNTQNGLLDAQNGATPQLEKSEQTLGSGGKLTIVLMGDLGEKTQEDEDVLYQSDNGLLVEKTVAHLEEIVEVADWGEEDDLLEAELSADHNIPKRNPPPQATTFSKRAPRSGISLLKLAEDRVAAKNLEVPGMSKTNLFIILQEVDDSSLSSLAVNCGISLDSDVTSELENLTLLRAKELAQAAIQQSIE